MATRGEWDAVQDDILRLLDVEQRFIDMGVKFTRPAKESGWRPCFARDREEGHASAACHVGTGPKRGYYVDKGGSHLTLSFFAFAAQFGGFSDWRAARKHYAEVTGVKLPTGREPVPVNEAVDWQFTRMFMLRPWAAHKPPVDGMACHYAGMQIGKWPRGSRFPQDVVAIPVYGPSLADADPVNYVLYRMDGTDLELYRGRDMPPEKHRMLTLSGGRPGLIGKHAMQHLDKAEIVWKVEGPTDLLAALTLIPDDLRDKHVFISTAFGAGESPQPWMLELLTGRDVILVGDADVSGQLGVSKWQAYLHGRVKRLRVATLPYPVAEKKGKDLRDFFRDGKSYADLLALAGEPGPLPSHYSASDPSESPETSVAVTEPIDVEDLAGDSHAVPPTAGDHSVKPPPDGPPDAMDIEDADTLARLRIHVLGYHPDMSVLIFCEATRHVHRIGDLGKLSYPNLVLMAGQPARDQVSVAPTEGRKSMEQVRRAIAVAASRARLPESSLLGQGLWRCGDSLAVVVGSNVLMFDPDCKTDPVLSRFPRHREILFDLADEGAWCNVDKLIEYWRQASDVAWRRSALAELIDILRRWNWIRPADCEVCAGLVMATWIQTLWTWRPWVILSGSTSVGKTTLASDVIAKLFGSLAMVFNKPTEAGIRQHVGSRSCTILIDEFENDHNRVRVMELLRTTSRGGEVHRGSADQRGRSYGLKHIPWMAAIENGLQAEADRNRSISMDLDRISPDVFGKLHLPNESAMADLGLRLFASILRVCQGALAMVSLLRGRDISSAHGRVVECYSVPVSCLAAVRGLEFDGARELLLGVLPTGTAAMPVRDEQELLSAILESFIDLGGGVRYSLSQILCSENLYNENRAAVERHGILYVSATSGRKSNAVSFSRMDLFRVFVNPRAVRRYLLRGTRWEAMDCEQILMRLPGARKSQRRIDARRVWGVDFAVADFIGPEPFDKSDDDVIGGFDV